MLTQLVIEQIFYISLLIMQYNKNMRSNITKQGLYFIRSFGVLGCAWKKKMIDFFFLGKFYGAFKHIRDACTQIHSSINTKISCTHFVPTTQAHATKIRSSINTNIYIYI